MGKELPVIPGPRVEIPAQLHTLQRRLAHLLGREATSFPGAQPVSLTKRHLRTLVDVDYYVCEKSDGIRCLMYISREPLAGGPEGKLVDAVYLIDRKNDYYRIPRLHFPVPGDSSFKASHEDTVLDGELVLDTYPDGRRITRFLLFDCLMMDGKLVTDKPLDRRLGYCKMMVHEPLERLLHANPDVRKRMPFSVGFKEMQLAYGIKMMFEAVIPALHHGNDGLIFTPLNTSYKYGTDDMLLKWKPSEENSIDFRLRLSLGLNEHGQPDVNMMPTFELYIFTGRRGDADPYQYFGQMYVDDEEWQRLQHIPLVDAIVECVRDTQGRWRLMRFREDKLEANHISTLKSMLESIEDGVTKDDLLQNAFAMREAFKARRSGKKPAEASAKPAAATPVAEPPVGSRPPRSQAEPPAQPGGKISKLDKEPSKLSEEPSKPEAEPAEPAGRLSGTGTEPAAPGEELPNPGTEAEAGRPVSHGLTDGMGEASPRAHGRSPDTDLDTETDSDPEPVPMRASAPAGAAASSQDHGSESPPPEPPAKKPRKMSAIYEILNDTNE